MVYPKVSFWVTDYQTMISCVFFNNCDIIVPAETWRTDEISLSGHEFFTISNKKHHQKKNGRSSGGITLGFKTALKQGIKLISVNANFLCGPKLIKPFLISIGTFFYVLLMCPLEIPPIFNPTYFVIFKMTLQNLVMRALLC